jgi:putative redox protein
MGNRQEEQRSHRNGLDLDLLDEVVDAIRNDPREAAVTIRTRHRWDDGLAVDGSAREFTAVGDTGSAFTFRTDWPPEGGGQDTGPAPGELVLGALGGCVAMTYVTKASMRGIEIQELEVSIEGSVDLRGFFEVEPVRPGPAGVSVTVRVRSSAANGELEELGRIVTRTSGVFDALANPLPINLAVERLQ